MPSSSSTSLLAVEDRAVRSPAPTGRHRSPVLTALALAAFGWLVSWAVVTLVGPVLGVPLAAGQTFPGVGPVLVVLGCSLSGVAACASAWRLLARPGGVPVLVVSVTGALLAGGGTVVLHGTRWGFSALYSDAGFRTQAVTRFADSPALADYSYRGLPTYYPPLLPWVEGRVAALLGVPGWTVMKPAELLACLLVPIASWVLWRRVISEPVAAWLTAGVALATMLPTKPDEWLVLVLVVPWWLEVVRGVRSPDRVHWGAVRQGVVLGLLLMLHTYFFLPLALATGLGVVVDLLVRRPVRPRPVRAGLIGLVGLLVSSPSWLPMVLLRLRGLPSDNLQLRWSPPGFDAPPWPLPTGPVGVLGLIGVVWVVLRVRRSRLAEAMALALVSSYAVVVVGQLLQRFDVAILPEKSSELCEALLVISGLCGIARLAPSLLARGGPGARRLAVGLAVALGVWGAVQLQVGDLVPPGTVSQHVRYPDGTFPAGGPPPQGSHWHPWGVPHENTGPSVVEVQRAWQRLTGGPLDSSTVLVSARADVPETVPVHTFVPWKSIYSHPNGRFEARVRLLQRVGECPTARCAAELLRGNDYDAVDGLLLNRSGNGYYTSVAVDTFPEAWQTVRIPFDPELFAAPYFRRVDLAEATLIQVRG